MPHYDYHCDNCDYYFEKSLKIVEHALPESEPCPDCSTTGQVKQYLDGAPGLGDPIKLGIKKPDAAFGDVISKIKSAHPKGNWNNRRLINHGGR